MLKLLKIYKEISPCKLTPLLDSVHCIFRYIKAVHILAYLKEIRIGLLLATPKEN